MKTNFESLKSLPNRRSGFRQKAGRFLFPKTAALCRVAATKPLGTSMFSVRCWMLNVAVLASAASALAEVHYVDVNSTNATPPYTNWITAATNIQDAVDAAVAGDEVVVTNGAYAGGGRTSSFGANVVLVDKPLSLRSVNGPQVTTIYGPGIPTVVGCCSARCVYLTSGASLSGFTLTKGYLLSSGGRTGGAGVLCAPGAVVSNCVITDNRISDVRSTSGGGASGGTLNNCTLTGNAATIDTGFRFQSSYHPFAYGGGAAGCTLNNCVLTGNLVGVTNWFNGSDNTAEAYGGGAYQCTLSNCTLNSNRTVAITYSYVGEISEGGGAYQSVLNNCISFQNFDYYDYDGVCYDCNSPGWLANGNNWFGGPFFVDYAGGNLRLQSNSPCINAGNYSYVTGATDLDSNPRITGGTVDIGAYEFQAPASMISYAWLQHFNLSINPATDTADPDGDSVDNYHEWLARSNPTNPFSFPPFLTLIPYGANVILTWPTNAVGFTLQSTTNSGSPTDWTTNSPAPVVIGGQNVIINPISAPQQFYRLIR
jgi:hypothetical protein